MGLPAGHPVVGGDDLQQAVRATLQSQGTPMPSSAAVPAGPAALVAQAEEQRRQRKFEAATTTYRALIAADAMTADTWADYADALASVTSSLSGEPAQALERALALDARHPKALWLKASLEHEQRQYTAAAKTWQALLAVVPQDSSDARIIRANLAEATRLASART